MIRFDWLPTGFLKIEWINRYLDNSICIFMHIHFELGTPVPSNSQHLNMRNISLRTPKSPSPFFHSLHHPESSNHGFWTKDSTTGPRTPTRGKHSRGGPWFFPSKRPKKNAVFCFCFCFFARLKKMGGGRGNFETKNFLELPPNQKKNTS